MSGNTLLQITAPAKDWVVLRQAHMAATVGLAQNDQYLGAWAGALIGKGFSKAVRDTSSPSIAELKDEEHDDTLVTVTLNKYLFSGVFSSLNTVHTFLEQGGDSTDPLPELSKNLIDHAWLIFKTEAILAEVG